jgi:hypothetical protein
VAASRRARAVAAILLGACVLPLPGCFTIMLWDSAPQVTVEKVLGAEVDASHVLAVDLRLSNGAIERCHYALAGPVRPAFVVDRTDPPLPRVERLSVPASSPGSKIDGDRFAPGSELALIPWPGGLEVRQVGASRDGERPDIPGEGVDWSKPTSYGRVLLTAPAVALDVVTSPIQLLFACWILIAHPSS